MPEYKKKPKKNPKTYTGLQWTGDNEEDFEGVVNCQVGYSGDLEVSYWLPTSDDPKVLRVPLNSYLVIPSKGKMRVLDKHDFDEKFDEV